MPPMRVPADRRVPKPARRHVVIAGLTTALLGTLIATLFGTAYGQVSTESPEPKASARVQLLLSEAEQSSQAKRSQDALRMTEQALIAARQGRDSVGEAMALSASARLLQGLGQVEAAARTWREAAAAWERVGSGPGQIEALAMAAVLLGSDQPKEAAALHAQALALGRAETRRPLAAAQALHAAGRVGHERGRLGAARELYLAALVRREKLAPSSLDTAETLSGLASVADKQGDLAAARDYQQRALIIQEQQVPGSPDVAVSLNNLGSLAWRQSDAKAARDYYERALAVAEPRTPTSLEVAKSLTGIGNVAWRQGELTTAADYHRRALALREKLAPSSLSVAGSLNNLGLVARQQGDLTAAADYLRRALALKEKLAPNSLELGNSLTGLGSVAWEQGDFTAAAEYHRRALALRERLAPNSLDVAQSLNNLGTVVQKQGDLRAAAEYLRRALALKEKLATDALSIAASLTNLGAVAADQGDLAAAADYSRRALDLQERQAPNSLEVAASLNNLGNVALLQGDLTAAGDYYRRALALREKLAPNSLDVADSLKGLGVVAWRRGDKAEAERGAQHAWNLVRQQAAAVTGDEARQAFGESTAHYAAHLIRCQTALRKTGEAFTTLEESRAQTLQQLLLERPMLLRGIAEQRWSEYRAAVRVRDQAEQALSRSNVQEALARRKWTTQRDNKAGPDTVNKAQTTLDAAVADLKKAEAAYARARVQVDALWAEIKKNAPRLNAAPLTLEQASSVLSPGTLFVAFAVGEEESQVFLLRRGADSASALSVYPVALSSKELQKRVEQWRQQIVQPTSRLAGPRLSRELFAQVFPRAARPAIRQAKRLLLSPDGPLWDLSFAALVTNATGRPRYLGEEKPLTYTPSLTLWAEIRNEAPRRREAEPVQALVLGDPIFDRPPAIPDLESPAAAASIGGERSYFLTEGRPPQPLPHTRWEAIAIAQLYRAEPLLAERATEAALRERIELADVIHLATHGLFLRRAASSGILLTVPEREPAIGETSNDGVLQAWEIQNQLQLRAALVVLSACETGRGQFVSGEGLIGLTRALQYAGARAVVASQWAVADQSTARLMVTFHRLLRQGRAKDEALRQAMRQIRRNPVTAHPYYWAAFLLTGDPENGMLTSVARDQGSARDGRSGSAHSALERPGRASP